MTETDNYRITEFGADIILGMGTMFLFHVGYVVLGEHDTLGAITGTLFVVFPWVAGLILLLLAFSDIDVRPHGTKIAFLIVASVLAGNIIGVAGLQKFGTDTVFFAFRAGEEFVAGTNPYTVPMVHDGLSGYEHIPPITDLTTGENVTAYSYPAGPIYAFSLHSVFGIQHSVGFIPLMTFAMSVVYLIAVSPPEIAMVPPIIATGMGMWNDALGGLIDGLWLLPLLIAMQMIYQDDWLKGGLWFGLASSMKQIPWIMAPFLLIWVYQKHGRKGATKLVGASTAVFTVINLPFIVWNPKEWLAGVLTPLVSLEGPDLMAQGVGISAFRWIGELNIPKAVFTFTTLTAVIVSLVVYWHLSEDKKWVAFIMPPVILFFGWRFLPFYLTWSLPIFFMAYLGSTNALPAQNPRTQPSVP